MNAKLKKVIIPMGGLIAGVLLTFSAIRLNPTLILSSDSRKLAFGNIVSDHFFNQDDPFERMEDHMKGIDDQNSKTDPLFDSLYSNKFNGGSINDVSQREDDDFIYYDVSVKDLESTPVTTNIEDGHVTISGETENKERSDKGGNSAESFFKLSFSRTLPVPEGVKEGQMEVIPDKDKLTLKFPKIKT